MSQDAPARATTNTERANRLLPVLKAHAEAMHAEALDHAEGVEHLLCDIMHFCDQMGLDFDDLLHLADMCYRAESEGPSPLALPDPLIPRD